MVGIRPDYFFGEGQRDSVPAFCLAHLKLAAEETFNFT